MSVWLRFFGPKTLVLGLVDMPRTAVLALPQEYGA